MVQSNAKYGDDDIDPGSSSDEGQLSKSRTRNSRSNSKSSMKLKNLGFKREPGDFQAYFKTLVEQV